MIQKAGSASLALTGQTPKFILVCLKAIGYSVLYMHVLVGCVMCLKNQLVCSHSISCIFNVDQLKPDDPLWVGQSTAPFKM